MSAPLQSFLGGLSIPLPVHSLLLLNGNVFGISGFVHRALRGSTEAFMGVTGLVLGGVVIGALERNSTQIRIPSLSTPQFLLSGLLVGLGSKLSNGCTSGHMVAGVARFSLRSIVATATFITTGVITARFFHQDLQAASQVDWTLGLHGTKFLALQALPLTISLLLYKFGPNSGGTTELKNDDATEPLEPVSPRPFLRNLAYFAAGFQFSLALRLSNLSEPIRVVSFLLLPIHPAFDSSLAFLAAGALPFASILYHYARGAEKPRLGGKWSVPKKGKIDTKLLVGAAIFGVGWGLAGICPGPGLVNLGRAMGSGTDIKHAAKWLFAVGVGGLLLE